MNNSEKNNNIEMPNDKTVGIVSYLTFIGFLVALIIHNNGNNKTDFSSFHIRQALGIILAGVAVYVSLIFIAIIPLVNLLLVIVYPVIAIVALYIWYKGIIGAIRGEMKPVPIIGEEIQKILSSVK